MRPSPGRPTPPAAGESEWDKMVMIISPAQEKTAVWILLTLFLLLVLVFGAGSYTAALGSDPFGIVHFARHLARGEFYSDVPVYDWIKPAWSPGESHFVLGGNYIKSGSRMYNKYTIGFPLLLAFSIRVLGSDSVYYFNLIVLLALLLLIFLLASRFLRSRPGGRWLALLAPLIFLVMVEPAWRMALRPSHDLAGLTLLVAGSVLAFRGLGDSPRIRVISLLVGAGAFGCAGTLRLPNVLAAVPAGLYFLARIVGRVRWWKIVILALAGTVIFFLALAPALIQNQLTSGHPLRPPRPEIVGSERTVLGGLDQASPPPLWIGFFPTTFPEVLRYFGRLWGPLFILLFLLGLFSLRRRPETWFLLAGLPLVLVLFYSMWVHLMTRYMLAAQPFLAVLAAAGVGRLLSARRRWWSAAGVALAVLLDFWIRWRFPSQYVGRQLDLIVPIAGALLWLLFVVRRRPGPARRAPAVLALALFGLFIARYGPPWWRRPPTFQLAEARRFGADLDAVVPPGSIVFSTKPFSHYIYLFSSSYGLRPFEMGRLGVDPREACERLLDRGIRLYLLDNTSFKRDSAKAIPLFKEYFDLTAVGRLPGVRYHLAGQFGKPVCTIYRIEPWRERELQVDFEVPAGQENLMMVFNLRGIYDPDRPRRRLEFEVNGEPVAGALFNGMNFLNLDQEALSRPRSTLTVRSDRPLPRDLDIMVTDLFSPYLVDLAGEIGFPDRDSDDIFNSFRFLDGPLVRLGWGRTGRVAIPTISLPGTTLVGEVTVRPAQRLDVPVACRVALNGEEIARFILDPESARERFSFRLPERLFASTRGELEFAAIPPPSRPLSRAEEYWGAFLFESISVQRWSESYQVPLSPRESGLVAFACGPLPGEDCPEPYRVLLDGEEIPSRNGSGIRRLLIASAPFERPNPLLEVRGPDGTCRPVFTRGPLTRKITQPLLIDIGARDDWVFLQEGFYPPELHRGRLPVRWTAGEARMILPLFPPPGREARLSLKTAGSRPPATLSSSPKVSAWLDGEKIGDQLLKKGGALYAWTFPLKGSTPRIAELVFRVDTWLPSEFLPVKDNRELGLMVEWIKLEFGGNEE